LCEDFLSRRPLRGGPISTVAMSPNRNPDQELQALIVVLRTGERQHGGNVRFE